MMKSLKTHYCRFLLIGAAVFLLSCSKHNDLKDHGLNGKVKSTFLKSFKPESRFGKWEPGEMNFWTHVRTNYDEKGMEISCEYFNARGELLEKDIVEREDAKITGERHYDGEGTLRYHVKVFERSKDTIEYESYNHEGKLRKEGLIIKVHNRTAKEIVKDFYVAGHKTTMKLRQEFFDPGFQGEIVFEEFLESHVQNAPEKNEDFGLSLKAYNEKGELLYEIEEERETESITQFDYTEGIYKETTTFYTYDKKGNITETKQVDKDGEVLHHFKFEYFENDKKGNWTKQLMFEHDTIPIRVLVREIEYY